MRWRRQRDRADAISVQNNSGRYTPNRTGTEPLTLLLNSYGSVKNPL